MRRRTAFRPTLAILLSTSFPALAMAQLRIAAYNTETAFNSNGTPNAGLQSVLQGMGNETVGAIAKRVDLLCLTEQNNTTGTTTAQIVTMMNSLYGAGTYAKGSLISGATNTPNTDSSALIYDTTKVQLIAEKLVGATGTSGQVRQEIRYQLRPVGYSPNADFYVYVGHYKANGTSSDMNRRNIEAQNIRADANTLPAGSRILYTGDFNLTGGTSEAAWSTLTASGNGQAFDPLNGSWSNAAKTWSTTNLGSRLDFQFNTAPTIDGHGFSLINGSYHSLGNNGTTPSGSAANSGSNTALTGLPNRSAVLSGLTTASDHYPVVADYRIPAKMNVNVAPLPPTVIVGASVPINVTVSNNAPVISAAGADGLDYSVGGTGSVSGAGNGTALPALSVGATHLLTLTAGTIGTNSGTISVNSTSQEVANGTFSQNVSVQVIDHAQPALSVGSIDFGIVGRGLGGASKGFSIFSRLGQGATAGLDLDSLTSTGDSSVLTTNAATFTNLEAGPADQSHVDFIANIAAGSNGGFSASYTFHFSDADLPGATLLASKSLQLTGTIATPGDTDVNGIVNFDDYSRVDNGFNIGLTGWANGDFDGNGIVGFDDYALIDAAFNAQFGGAILSRAVRWLSGDDRSDRGLDAPALQMIEQHFNDFGEPYAAAFTAAIPEPASSLPVVIGVLAMARRR